MSDIQQVSTNSDLVPVWYYEAFGLKIRGVSYEKIAEKLGKKPQTVRLLFSKSGKMYHFWREYVEATKAENVDDAMDMIFAHIPDVLRMEIMAAQDHKDNPMVALMARHKLMDYSLGKPEDRLKINASVAVMTFADWVKQTTLKKQENDRSGNTKTGAIPEGSG